MAFLAKSIGAALEKNDIDIVIARDLKEPFRDETRKAKRNVITAGFAAILVAALDVKVDSFAGLSAASGEIAADITRGLACLAVIYFLIAYVMDALLDYTAWRIEMKRLKITPYVLLARSVERTFRGSAEQLKTAAWYLEHLRSFGEEWHANPINVNNHKSALGQIAAVEKHQAEVIAEIRPLLSHWQRTLRSLAFETSGRRAARAIRMWAWDLAMPLLVAGLAIARTADGLSTAIPKLLGVPL